MKTFKPINQRIHLQYYLKCLNDIAGISFTKMIGSIQNQQTKNGTFSKNTTRRPVSFIDESFRLQKWNIFKVTFKGEHFQFDTDTFLKCLYVVDKASEVAIKSKIPADIIMKPEMFPSIATWRHFLL